MGEATTVENRTLYGDLSSEFFDLATPEAPVDEVNFYKQFLEGAKGPLLEAMCGSGRVLVPLLKANIALEGVDNSCPMVRQCRARLAALNVQSNIYQQDILALDLPKKYGAILVAMASIQLFSHTEIVSVLASLKQQLLPGAKLLLDTYVPWDALCYETSSGEQQFETSDGYILKNTSHSKAYKTEQYYITECLYQKYKGNHCIQEKKEIMQVYWYYKYEMALLLEKAGFKDVVVHSATYRFEPSNVFYEATC